MQALALDSPFRRGERTPSLLRLVPADGTIDIVEDPPEVPGPLVGTLDPSITPAVAAADIATIATDNRSLVIRLLSRLISAITVTGEAVRMARTIPDAAATSWRRANASS